MVKIRYFWLLSFIVLFGCSIVPTYEYDEVDVKPEVVSSSFPSYPPWLRDEADEGDEFSVKVKALVDTDGSVIRVKVTESSGYRKLDNNVKENVFLWEFTPGEHEGELVRVWVTLSFKFILT